MADKGEFGAAEEDESPESGTSLVHLAVEHLFDKISVEDICGGV